MATLRSPESVKTFTTPWPCAGESTSPSMKGLALSTSSTCPPGLASSNEAVT